MKDNPPAFPQSLSQSGPFGGMTLRDYFAGQAFHAAWLAFDKGYYEGNNFDIAMCAYQFADAMLEARKEQGDG